MAVAWCIASTRCSALRKPRQPGWAWDSSPASSAARRRDWPASRRRSPRWWTACGCSCTPTCARLHGFRRRGDCIAAQGAGGDGLMHDQRAIGVTPTEKILTYDGLGFLKAIIDGTLPKPPIAEAVDGLWLRTRR